MTLARRVAAVEASLSPTQLVVAWITEAHSSGNVESYVGSLVAADPPQAPLDRLARQAARGARNATHGKRPEVVQATVRSALRETVFRFELVVRINVSAYELLEREALIDAALAAQVTLLAATEKRDAATVEGLATRRDLALVRVSELRAAQEARSIVEERYLDGHGALFPDAAQAWTEQIRSSEAIADAVVRLAELDGLPPPVPPDPEAPSRRTAEFVADLVEPAKADSLDKLGEGRRALDVAAGWVRAKLAPKAAGGDAVADQELIDAASSKWLT
jgi:hypothetical protein